MVAGRGNLPAYTGLNWTILPTLSRGTRSGVAMA
jgi:hypothetical protein